MSDKRDLPKKPKRKPTGDYETGYAKPPKDHQFPKGKSGNPAGRPPKARPSNAELFSEMLNGDVVINRKGKPEKMPFMQAFFLSMRNGMLQAKPQDQMKLFATMKRDHLLHLEEEFRAATSAIYQEQAERDRQSSERFREMLEDLKRDILLNEGTGDENDIDELPG